MRKYIYPIVYIIFSMYLFLQYHIVRNKVEEKGYRCIKSIPQGLQCLPYNNITGATLCYKFVSSLTLGEDVVSKSIDKLGPSLPYIIFKRMCETLGNR